MDNKSGVKAFRSEVDILRNVIRKNVNEIVNRKLGDIEDLKKRQELIEKSLKSRKAAKSKASAPDLKPLRERMERIERDARAAGPAPDLKPLRERMARLESEVRAAGKGTPAEKGIRNLAKKGDIERVLGDMVESRLSGLNNKVLMLRREIEMLRGELESSRVRKLEGEFQRNIGSMKSQLNKVIIDGRGLEERLCSEIETLKMETGNLGKTSEQVKGLNIEELRRDLEIIKTKQEWIENNIERIDIKPLLRKMEELEHRIMVIRTSSPIVLE